MADQEYNPQAMDEAAKEAELDLSNLTEEAVRSMADWWAKWYLKAGHKRLGRLLVKINKGG